MRTSTCVDVFSQNRNDQYCANFQARKPQYTTAPAAFDATVSRDKLGASLALEPPARGGSLSGLKLTMKPRVRRNQTLRTFAIAMVLRSENGSASPVTKGCHLKTTTSSAACSTACPAA